MGEITINLNELLLKEAQGSLTNSDFTKVWTDVVMMPIYRIEYIITTSKHTETTITTKLSIMVSLIGFAHFSVMSDE